MLDVGDVGFLGVTGGGGHLDLFAHCDPPRVKVKVAPVAPEKTQTVGASSKPNAAGKTAPTAWSFSFSIGRDQPFLSRA
jgi:hypothetical protein